MFGSIGLYFRLGVLLLIIGLGATAYIYYLKYQNVGQKYEQVLQVNKNNQRVVKELIIDKQIERAITAKELAETQKRASATDVIKREMENAPGAQDLAGPYWDELSKRLRSTGSGTAD